MYWAAVEEAAPADARREPPPWAPSGSHYLVAGPSFPAGLPQELRDELVDVEPGGLVELQACHGGWGLGSPLVWEPTGPVPGARGAEGAFRLEWMRAVRVRPHGGRPRCVLLADATPAATSSTRPAARTWRPGSAPSGGSIASSGPHCSGRPTAGRPRPRRPRRRGPARRRGRRRG
ncbi:unnamed protein product, partial [Prorocentrum cordatum]